MKLSRPLILLALAAILPLIVLSAALGGAALRDDQQSMQAAAEARVDLTSLQVERDLEHHIAVLSAVAQSPMFDGPIDAQAAAGFLNRIARTQPYWRGLMISDAAGRRIASSTRPEAYPVRIVDTESHGRVVKTGRPLIDLLEENAEIRKHADRKKLEALVDPANYLGVAGEMVDRVLAMRK